MSYRVPNETTIVRVRIKSRRLDPLTAQLRLTRILNEARVHPRGLPASAIVFVKTLRDPLPGGLNLSPGGGASIAWEQALSKSLDEMARNAARPALGHVPANAECVLFLDKSELLAALAADWCSGSALLRWWWKSLFRSTDVTTAVIREWTSSIEHVPAAFLKLAPKDLAPGFVRALTSSAVNLMLENITVYFGLKELRDVLAASRDEAQGDSGRAVVHRDDLPREQAQLFQPKEFQLLRTRLAPEAFAPRLDHTPRVLLAAALLLERAPSLLRERGFGARLVQSLRAVETPSLAAALDAAEPQKSQFGFSTDLPETTAESQLHRISASSGSDVDKHVSESSSAEESRSDFQDQHNRQFTRISDGPDGEPDRVLFSGVRAAPDRTETEGIANSVESATLIEDHRATVELEAAAIPQTEFAATTIELTSETRLGGVFYLINAAIALDLYGDFTTPLEPGINLPIWDFLALAGRELIGRSIEVDPIWPLLAKLAGREAGEQPGARFDPPDEWRVPPDWLNAFPERCEWGYQIIRGRLSVRHPAGFEVLDVKVSSLNWIKDIETRLATETRCYTNVAGFQRRFGEVHRRKRERSVDRWTRRIADYLRARLARSLGIRRKDELFTMLFARAARIEVSPARLDVFLSLAELPIEIRLAGLDRDPGWVPVAGRAIAFHYD